MVREKESWVEKLPEPEELVTICVRLGWWDKIQSRPLLEKLTAWHVKKTCLGAPLCRTLQYSEGQVNIRAHLPNYRTQSK